MYNGLVAEAAAPKAPRVKSMMSGHGHQVMVYYTTGPVIGVRVTSSTWPWHLGLVSPQLWQQVTIHKTWYGRRGTTYGPWLKVPGNRKTGQWSSIIVKVKYYQGHPQYPKQCRCPTMMNSSEDTPWSKWMLVGRCRTTAIPWNCTCSPSQ